MTELKHPYAPEQAEEVGAIIAELTTARTEALAYQVTIENLRAEVERYKAMCAELAESVESSMYFCSSSCFGCPVREESKGCHMYNSFSAYRAMTGQTNK